MNTTPVSLLEHLRHSADEAARTKAAASMTLEVSQPRLQHR
jgi:hypothetical protein